MNNHSEIIEKIAERVAAYLKSGGDMEEDLWPSADSVLMEIKEILETADPPTKALATPKE